ncbi:Hypothetical predicted protein [Cloeon dipterum]|uniref:Major facilitator superfamily (MFS) profile domain-containing protein n=1 Tax=Cloeon dipterum TaxID=197152 RepID=A0A8S1D7F5_9INSE|nr:Hypothetical predicted protein [Cloeon dipterum]
MVNGCRLNNATTSSSNNGKSTDDTQKCPKHEIEVEVLGKDFNNQNQDVDFETAIEMTGYGRFHYFLLVVCGFVSTSEEMDVVSMSFILPSAQCDLKLNTYTKGWLNSIIFIGMMSGAYIWGSVADSLGRKKVLILISVMTGICILASGFSQSYSLFMFFRFLNGAALGGSGPVIWSYFAEFQPKKKRGSMLSFMAAFWTLGNLFVAGLAWIVIPSGIGYESPDFKLNSWRIYLLICSLPSFLVAMLLCFLPESPKFLLSRGEHDKAIEVFRHIYVMNTGSDASSYPVRTLEVAKKAIELKFNEEYASKNSCSGMLGDVMRNVINFSFHIGYYGLMMWFPELFNRFNEYSQAHPGQPATICGVTEYVVNSGVNSENSATCSEKIAGSVFLESLITVAAAIPSNIFAVLGIDRLGRKFFLVFSTFTSGMCAIGLYFVHSSTTNLVVSAVFSSAISCGNAALDCLITEVFPTNLRATGVAVSMIAARLGGIIGNIVIATLLDLYCPAPTFIIAFLLIGGGLLCLFLPNTTRAPLA